MNIFLVLSRIEFVYYLKWGVVFDSLRDKCFLYN